MTKLFPLDSGQWVNRIKHTQQQSHVAGHEEVNREEELQGGKYLSPAVLGFLNGTLSTQTSKCKWLITHVMFGPVHALVCHLQRKI